MINKINKLTLPAVILIASIILGGFYYASETNKRKSIEKQQFTKARDDRVAKYELVFRQECRNKWDATSDMFLKKLSLAFEAVEANIENRPRNGGFVNDDGSLIDEDVWIKRCVEKKIEILNELQ